MTDSKTATERLRELLDERGVKYTKRDGMKATSITHWYADGIDAEFAEQIKGGTRLSVTGLTPEQAIAATLGNGECAKCAEGLGEYADSLCDPLKDRTDKLLRCLENDWHISASWDGLRKFWCIELTEEGVRLRDAEMDSRAERTCKNVDDHKTVWFICSVCGYQQKLSHTRNYCPNCGAKVIA